MLAHELRNPLAAIRGALEVLRLGSADSAEAVKTWGIVDRQARQMVRLTDDLLDASRITRGAITLRKEEVNLGVFCISPRKGIVGITPPEQTRGLRASRSSAR